MTILTVLYHTPTDLEAFNTYYFQTHVPIAKKMPGLVSYTVSDGPVAGADGSPAAYPLVAQLEFASPDALQAALGSAEGQAAVADIPNFASGGLTIITYNVKTV